MQQRTRVMGETEYSRLADLSVALINGDDEALAQFQPGRVYMATHSIGGRSYTLDEHVHHDGGMEIHRVVDPSSDGAWQGFLETDVLSLKWVSATSGATLVADAMEKEGRWALSYTGPEEEGRESQYLDLFIAAVDPAAPIEVKSKSDAFDPTVQSVAAQPDVRHYDTERKKWVDDHSIRERCVAFARAIGVSIVEEPANCD